MAEKIRGLSGDIRSNGGLDGLVCAVLFVGVIASGIGITL